MKSIFSLLLICTCFFATAQNDSTTKALALVDKVDGLLVFTDSKPVASFEILGKVNTTVMGADYEGTRDALIGKAKKKYPTANGIIYHSYNINGVPWVEAIKFL